MQTSLFLTLALLACLANAQTCKKYIPNDWQNTRYTDHNNSTITDNTTKLMWKQCAEGLIGSVIVLCHRHSINAYLEDSPANTTHLKCRFKLCRAYSSFAEHKDWRLPNVNELRSLIAFNYYRYGIQY